MTGGQEEARDFARKVLEAGIEQVLQGTAKLTRLLERSGRLPRQRRNKHREEFIDELFQIAAAEAENQ